VQSAWILEVATERVSYFIGRMLLYRKYLLNIVCMCDIYVYIVADPGWRDSHPVLGATLTTTVSGVYNAGRLSTGLGSRAFNRDTNVILVPCQLGK